MLLLRLHRTPTTDLDLLLRFFLPQIPLKTGILTGYSVNGLEKHTQIEYMLPPKSRKVHQVSVSFFVVGSVRKQLTLLQKRYSGIPQITGPLEMSSMQQATDFSQGLSPILWS